MGYREEEEYVLTNRDPDISEQICFCLASFFVNFIMFSKYFGITVPNEYWFLSMMSSFSSGLFVTLVLYLVFMYRGIYEWKFVKIKVEDDD